MITKAPKPDSAGKVATIKRADFLALVTMSQSALTAALVRKYPRDSAERTGLIRLIAQYQKAQAENAKFAHMVQTRLCVRTDLPDEIQFYY